MKRTIQIFLTSIALLSVFSLAGEAHPQQRNVKSSCQLLSTSGAAHSYKQRGKCIIRTYQDGDYLMVEVKTPWDSVVKGKPDIMRLENKPSCNFWQYYSSNSCYGGFWSGDEWSYVVVSEGLESGKATFSYSVGNAYMVTYDGSLPRP